MTSPGESRRIVHRRRNFASRQGTGRGARAEQPRRRRRISATDEEIVAGALTEAGGEPVVVLAVDEDSFERAQLVIFCRRRQFRGDTRRRGASSRRGGCGYERWSARPAPERACRFLRSMRCCRLRIVTQRRASRERERGASTSRPTLPLLWRVHYPRLWRSGPLAAWRFSCSNLFPSEVLKELRNSKRRP